MPAYLFLFTLHSASTLQQLRKFDFTAF